MVFYELALRTPPRFIFAHRVDRVQGPIEFRHPDFIEITVREGGKTHRISADGEESVIKPMSLGCVFPDVDLLNFAENGARQKHSTFAFVATDPFRRFDSERESIPLHHLRCRVSRGESALIPCGEPLGDRYGEALRRIQRVISFVSSERPGDGLKAIAECYSFFAFLSELVLFRLEDPLFSGAPAERVYAERAARMLRERYRERMTVGEIAVSLQLSEGYLHRLFKACYGMGPIEYLNRYRVEVAVDRMKNEGLSLAEAARAVGVDDASYMSRLFKRVKGVSARDYFREEEVRGERLPYPPLCEKK